MGDLPEVPDRTVQHDVDDDQALDFGDLVGEAQTLPMTSTLKAKARLRRQRLDELGGFGFGGGA